MNNTEIPCETEVKALEDCQCFPACCGASHLAHRSPTTKATSSAFYQLHHNAYMLHIIVFPMPFFSVLLMGEDFTENAKLLY